MVKVKRDLTGQKFGRLTVLKQCEEDYIDNNGIHYAKWWVQCDCNSETFTVLGKCLKSGETKSCGCLRDELSSNRMKIQAKKYNTYDLTGEYGIGFTSNTNEEFWFDLEDYDKIKDYCWMSDGDYVMTIHNKKSIFLHRIVMNVSNIDYKEIKVDHKNHPKIGELKYDNRKSNLRLTNSSNNAKNHHIHSNNTSGFTGVCWDKRSQKWRAYIKLNNKRIDLGSFNEKMDAVKARKKAEEKYFGEYSFDNSQQAI